tara:strand:+ start:82 stop:372 length:291 start_codon:yes stop_codon:yes gene_type:complete
LTKRKNKPTKAELWKSIQTIAHECVSLRERLNNLENLFDMLLSFKGINKEFVEFVETKLKENADEINKVQKIDKKDNEGSDSNKGARAEGIRQNAE